jgi:ribose/xylose/arabinose/galactoside ABC-type transport system permease subunit
MISRYKREASALLAYVVLLVTMGVIAPAFFDPGNLRDLAMNNAAVLIVAVGMTLVILAGEIDISVGSQFAVCTVAAGALAKAPVPIIVVLPLVILIGALLGAVGGLFIGRLRLPSIVVTLALMVGWRDGLRWVTEGEWIQDLPANFQWLGLGQAAGQAMIILAAALLLAGFAWALGNLKAGRAIYAVGSDAEAARLGGIEPGRIVFGVFVLMGALVGLAAMLNATRFSIVPSNAGTGLELKAIAAVVVGGTAINGGRGSLLGTLIGVALLGTIGTALTFAGINPFWEKAIQGAIILAAVASNVAFGQLHRLRTASADART